jgi:hypothetical protein
MPITDISKNLTLATMTVTGEWSAPLNSVWQLWADPRKLELWWGPPTYPATVVDHELHPQGKVSYFMTGPEGDQHHGWWTVLAVDAPHRLELVDGFADSDGNPNEELPETKLVVTFAELPSGETRMTMESQFPSTSAMEQVLAMGMEEGLAAAMSQIDSVLAHA